MSVKLTKNRTCPYCKKRVLEYNDDTEWVATKRRIKQYFHHSCFEEMVKESKVKYKN